MTSIALALFEKLLFKADTVKRLISSFVTKLKANVCMFPYKTAKQHCPLSYFTTCNRLTQLLDTTLGVQFYQCIL